MARSKYSAEMKYNILKLAESSGRTLSAIFKEYEIGEKTFYRWRDRFNNEGIDGLKEPTTWRKYSKELKLTAVNEYIAGSNSLEQICIKYGITSDSVLRRWISRYNSHKELIDTRKGMSHSMTEKRKTTLEERIEIAKHCIENQKNYQETASLYKVSYIQVYQWTKKYEELGTNGLEDRRGKSKEILTEEDKIILENRELKKKIERLQMENDLLKKLEELERRGLPSK